MFSSNPHGLVEYRRDPYLAIRFRIRVDEWIHSLYWFQMKMPAWQHTSIPLTQLANSRQREK